MPDRDVNTIQDLIYYQYAKIITRRAFSVADGKEAKNQHYGFIKKTFLELKNGKKSWSEITREDWQLIESDKKCIYCGSETNLHKEHLVPKSLKIKQACSSCDKIQGIHNQIWACENCNTSKSDKGLYDFYREKYPEDKKFYDMIPPLAEKKYLKTIYNCHICADTLNKGSQSRTEISVLDIDAILNS